MSSSSNDSDDDEEDTSDESDSGSSEEDIFTSKPLKKPIKKPTKKPIKKPIKKPHVHAKPKPKPTPVKPSVVKPPPPPPTKPPATPPAPATKPPTIAPPKPPPSSDVWQKLTELNTGQLIPALIKKHGAEAIKEQLSTLRIQNCGAGPKATDCGFLSLSKALRITNMWPAAYKTKTLHEQQYELRKLLWAQISATNDTLQQFLNYYLNPDIQHEPGFVEEAIASHKWTIKDKKLIELYILGILDKDAPKWSAANDYASGNIVTDGKIHYRARHDIEGDEENKKPKASPGDWRNVSFAGTFQGDNYSLSWLIQAPLFTNNRIRLIILSATRPYGLVGLPLDVYDPVFEEQDTKQYDIVNYIILWNQSNHWQLLGQRFPSDAADQIHVKLSYSQLPKYIRDTERANVKNLGKCHGEKKTDVEPDESSWTKLIQMDDGKVLDNLGDSFETEQIWLRGVGRLCINKQGTTDEDENTRFGQLLLPLFMDPKNNDPYQLRCKLSSDLSALPDLYDIPHMKKFLTSVRNNWCMHGGNYEKWIKEANEIELTGNQAVYMHFLQWTMNFDQRAFRKALLNEIAPFDPTKYTVWSEEVKYKQKDLVYVSINDKLLYYKCKVDHQFHEDIKRSTDPTSDAKDTNDYWDVVGYSPVPSKTSLRKYYSYEQAHLLFASQQPVGHPEMSVDVGTLNPCSRELKIPRRTLTTNQQYFWNWPIAVFGKWQQQILNTFGNPNTNFIPPHIEDYNAKTSYKQGDQVRLSRNRQTIFTSIQNDNKDHVPNRANVLWWTKSPNPNAIRLKFIEKVLPNTSERYDDSMFSLNGTWARGAITDVISDELRQGVSKALVGPNDQELIKTPDEIKIVYNIISNRDCWKADDKDKDWDYETQILSTLTENKNAPNNTVLLQSIRAQISDTDSFRLWSNIGLSIVVNLLKFPSDVASTRRHIILIRLNTDLVELNKEPSEYILYHVSPITLLSADEEEQKYPLIRRQFAIFIQSKTSKQWHLLGSPPRGETGQIFVNRWILWNYMPNWLLRSLFTEKQLLSSLIPISN